MIKHNLNPEISISELERNHLNCKPADVMDHNRDRRTKNGRRHL